MKCPACGAEELIHDTRDLPYTYKREQTVIAAVTGDFCPACAESILVIAESDRVVREMREFDKRSGDYTAEREQALSNATMDEIIAEIKLRKQAK